MNSQAFVEQLSKLSFPNVFNQYSDICDQCDHASSPIIRQSNLRMYLDTMLSLGVEGIWIGRDCGYRGARRTGIALTDEISMALLESRFKVHGLAKATAGKPIKERTSTEIWKALSMINTAAFLWNVFPFHPFEAENPLSNRCHSIREFDECQDILQNILRMLKPRFVVAVGSEAQRNISRLGFKSTRVRHPSYGGSQQFLHEILSIYGERGSR